MNSKKDRFHLFLSALNDGLTEREDVLYITLLSALAGQNIFLFGPPGTAKSLIARRIASVFKSEVYFDYLMQKFSAPEDVFGPISLKKLKEDEYVRKTDGYLPKADVAFLDEIWKSSPAILNTLLTIINEKRFKNGRNVEHVPLKFLIAASNEIPAPNQGLEALYDRFLARVEVKPVMDSDTFGDMVLRGKADDGISLDESIKVNYAELDKWQREINSVVVSDDVFAILLSVRDKLKNQVYVSDRRWQRCVYLIKASAFFDDRQETGIADCLLLPFCLWSRPEERPLIERALYSSMLKEEIDLGPLYQMLSEFGPDRRFAETLYRDTVKVKGVEYLKVSIPETNDSPRLDSLRRTVGLCDHKHENHVLFLPITKIDDAEWWTPLTKDSWDKKFCEIPNVKVKRCMDGHLLLATKAYYPSLLYKIRPEVLHRKGAPYQVSIKEHDLFKKYSERVRAHMQFISETKERLILLASFIPNSLLSGVIRFFDDESGRCQELLDRCVDILDKYHE